MAKEDDHDDRLSRRGPLCRAQYFEWWLSQSAFARAYANVSVEIKCPEGATRQAVDKAARLVLGHHEAFRTTFGLDAAGTPEQLVHPVSVLPPIAHVVVDGPSEHAQVIRELTSHEFDISTELPVKAIVISRAADQKIFLLICCPHIACDYRSMEIVRTEVLTFLKNPGSAKNPAVQNLGPQPLDIAFEEALRCRTRSEITAASYWARALSEAPLRNFWCSYNADTEIYRARAKSHNAPALLSRYALAHSSTPSATYTALIHIIISLISSHATTLVRFYFTGRSRTFENSVGPFHRELFSTMEISDSDTLSVCVRKAVATIMRARARYELDYLSFREAEIREESRRGSAFAWGTIVNLVDTPQFRARWRELPDVPTAAQCDEATYSVTPVGTDVNERGIEVFLSALIDSSFMSVTAEFNSKAISPEEAEILVRGPWEIIEASLAKGDDPKIAALRERYGFRRTGTREEGTLPTPGLRDTEALLERFPGVLASFLTMRQTNSSADIEAYVAVDRPDITPADLHDHVLAALKPAAAVVCPTYFVICEAVVGDRTNESSWRTARRLAVGTGIRRCGLPGHTEPEAALLRAISEANNGAAADLAKSYVESGGTLLKVPALLRQLSRAGFTGLRAKDFEDHARLYQLARRLSNNGTGQ